mmetsp:Transcript_16929/g.50623  ORF Transcript_16929/g.50623 Transcript_16929/m.50623 type:complete len:410 (-) Transcript_16929:70-1299(-)
MKAHVAEQDQLALVVSGGCLVGEAAAGHDREQELLALLLTHLLLEVLACGASLLQLALGLRLDALLLGECRLTLGLGLGGGTALQLLLVTSLLLAQAASLLATTSRSGCLLLATLRFGSSLGLGAQCCLHGQLALLKDGGLLGGAAALGQSRTLLQRTQDLVAHRRRVAHRLIHQREAGVRLVAAVADQRVDHVRLAVHAVHRNQLESAGRKVGRHHERRIGHRVSIARLGNHIDTEGLTQGGACRRDTATGHEQRFVGVLSRRIALAVESQEGVTELLWHGYQRSTLLLLVLLLLLLLLCRHRRQVGVRLGGDLDEATHRGLGRGECTHTDVETWVQLVGLGELLVVGEGDVIVVLVAVGEANRLAAQVREQLAGQRLQLFIVEAMVGANTADLAAVGYLDNVLVAHR